MKKIIEFLTMIDPRFYTQSEPLSIPQLLEIVTGAVYREGTSSAVSCAASLDYKNVIGGVLYITDNALLTDDKRCSPSVVLTTEKLAGEVSLFFEDDQTWIISVDHPRAAFAYLTPLLHQSRDEHLSLVSCERHLEGFDGVLIHPSASVANNVELGEGVIISAGAVIGQGVKIGANTFVGANAVITHAIVGSDCKIMAGAIIGQSGFGYAKYDGQQVPIPHLGRVIIADAVDIGANSTVDRGVLSDTVIGSQTKIDNLVQIAHNVKIGERCVFASQSGVSGSVEIGDDVMVGGQVGIADHVKIGNRSVILAGAGLMKDVADGEKWGGRPAKPGRQWMKEVAYLNKLTQNIKRSD